MEEIVLNADQEKKMLEFWNQNPDSPPPLSDIATHVFGIETDGRSKEAKAIRKALSKYSLKPKATDYVPVAEIVLSDFHKKYVDSNASSMGAVEMARILFSNPALGALNAETRAINEYIKTLDIPVVQQTEEIPEGDYEAPKTMDKIVRRINFYLGTDWEKEKLTPTQRKGAEMLRRYINTFRFVKQINEFEGDGDRKSFEDAFIRYTYDKPDLTQEEVDEYIVLATEVVISYKIQRRSERLQQMMDDTTNRNAADGGDGRITMSLVTAIATAQKEYNECVNRQRKLLEDLKEKRSTRLGKQLQDTASVLNLVQAWKEEETRKKYLKYAEIEQRAVAKEVEHLESLTDFKARILGLVKDEVLNG